MNGDARVVLQDGTDCYWKNCKVNPKNSNFDWEAAKTYMYQGGGKGTWYQDIFFEENERRKAARNHQSHYQSPLPPPPAQHNPYYSPAPSQPPIQSHYQGGYNYGPPMQPPPTQPAIQSHYQGGYNYPPAQPRPHFGSPYGGPPTGRHFWAT